MPGYVLRFYSTISYFLVCITTCHLQTRKDIVHPFRCSMFRGEYLLGVWEYFHVNALFFVLLYIYGTGCSTRKGVLYGM